MEEEHAQCLHTDSRGGFSCRYVCIAPRMRKLLRYDGSLMVQPRTQILAKLVNLCMDDQLEAV